VERFTVRQVSTSTGITELLNGDADFAAVPRARVPELHVGGNRNGPTKPGIRLNYPIPGLVINSLHFTLDIEPTPENEYGIIYPADDLHADGIPRNFFSNVNVRKAFAHLINFTMILQDQLLGEAYQPNTFAPSGLPYVNPAIPKYYFDLEKAAYYFDQAYFGTKKLTNEGFTVHLVYNSGNTIRQAICEQIRDAVKALAVAKGWPFDAVVKGPAWSKYLSDMEAHRLPVFCIGWLADYADIHNFAYPYAHSGGAFAAEQRYKNDHVDELIGKGLYTPDGPQRQAIYYEVEQIFYDEVPTVPLFVAIGRGYMRDWVQGRYYNPLHPGLYAYDHWKWPMTSTPGAQGYFVGDVNFDGKVSMDDIIAIVNAFGSYAGAGGMPVIHPRWNFRCDVDDTPYYRWRNRKIDMGDIVTALSNFGKTSQAWTPPTP
jgi:peptide/nickel transport system substrate-binding protein